MTSKKREKFEQDLLDLLARYEVRITEVDDTQAFPGADNLKDNEKALCFHNEYEEIYMPVLDINERLIW